MVRRRLALLWIAGLLLGVPARADETLEPTYVTVSKPPAEAVYRIVGTVGEDPVFNVTRTILVEAGPDGVRRLRPLTVRARGRVPTIAVEYGTEGSRTESWSTRELTGTEGPAVSMLQPPLTFLWSATQLEAERLVAGFPSAGAVRPPDEDFVHRRPFPTPGPADEDPLHFHQWSAADADLLVVLALLPGPWAPKQSRTQTLPLARPDGAPPLEQRTELTYLGTAKDGARFAFETTRAGILLANGSWEVRRTTQGHLTVLASVGTVVGGDLECAAGWYVEERKDPLVVIRHMAKIEDPEPHQAPVHPRRAARDVANLIELRRSDPDTIYEMVLRETYETAKAKVLALRPDAKLDDVEVRLWDADTDIGALTIESKQLNESPLAIGILQETGPPLVALGLLSKKTLEDLESLVPGGKAGLPWAAAFAVPSRNLLLFKPPHVTEVPMMAHELAHLASDRFGYLDRDRIGLGLPDGIDPAWADLDGTLAGWALGEAEAEVVEKAVERGVTSPSLLALGLKQYLKELAPPDPDADLFRHVMYLLYEASPHVVNQVVLRGDTMEKTLARAWKTFSYQTKQILFPDLKVRRSVLYPRGLALRGTGPIGATRLGSFSIQQAVARELGGTWDDADRYARALEDDVLVRFEKGMLWVSRWTDTADAARFAALLAAKIDGALLEVTEDAYLIVRVGEVEDAGPLIARLTKPLR